MKLSNTKENEIVMIKSNNNLRLGEMGVIVGTIARVVRRVFGMIQIKINSQYLIMRESIANKIDINKIKTDHPKPK